MEERFGEEMTRLMKSVLEVISPETSPDLLPDLPEETEAPQSSPPIKRTGSPLSLTSPVKKPELDHPLLLLWESGKRFIETFTELITQSETQFNSGFDSPWKSVLVVVCTLVVKALLRDIRDACSEEELTEFLALRKRLYQFFLWKKFEEFVELEPDMFRQSVFLVQILENIQKRKKLAKFTSLHLQGMLMEDEEDSSDTEEEGNKKGLSTLLVSKISDILDSDILFGAYQTTSRNDSRAMFASKAAFKEAALVCVRNASFFPLDDFLISGISLPNNQILIDPFEDQQRALRDGAVLFTFFHELAHSLNKRNCTSFADYFNCVHSAVSQTSAMVYVIERDRTFAESLDSFFPRPQDKEERSETVFEVALFGEGLERLTYSEVKYLLNPQNWGRTENAFRRGLRTANEERVGTANPSLSLVRVQEFITFPRNWCRHGQSNRY